MAVAKILKDYLNQNRVKFKAMKHKEVYTMQEVAHAHHISGKYLAKTVIVKIDKKFVMLVLQAHLKINIPKLKKQTGAKVLRLATEKEFGKLFPGCGIGAMPPFGNLYNVPVGVDKNMTENKVIVVNAGTHKDTILLKYADFEKLVKPKVFGFSKTEEVKPKKINKKK